MELKEVETKPLTFFTGLSRGDVIIYARETHVDLPY